MRPPATSTPTSLSKTVQVPVEADRAFALFTQQIGQWWPLLTHSVGEEQATDVEMDACVGGQIVESISDGRTCVWGTVTAWEPPHRVAFTWHPGRDAGQATAVEVSFLGHGDHTEVTLVHRGWDARLDSVAARRGYDSGWDIVLGRYVDRCSTGV